MTHFDSGIPFYAWLQICYRSRSAMESRICFLGGLHCLFTFPHQRCHRRGYQQGLRDQASSIFRKFRRELQSQGAGEGISAPLAVDHHVSQMWALPIWDHGAPNVEEAATSWVLSAEKSPQLMFDFCVWS
ncbi:hypothetical protein DVH24_003667 [Malus domestica]|uniref:Uncharacterized protein n=1 Tax=Malus domestica TaxID=3750 RepID=A0A498IJ50_MALDO|nr:hypothetical protein DVH24_003667 [Malus domestica]